jgi:hypothetical protein
MLQNCRLFQGTFLCARQAACTVGSSPMAHDVQNDRSLCSLLTSHSQSPFIVSWKQSRNVPTHADFLCVKETMLVVQAKETSCITQPKFVYRVSVYKRFNDAVYSLAEDNQTSGSIKSHVHVLYLPRLACTSCNWLTIFHTRPKKRKAHLCEILGSGR